MATITIDGDSEWADGFRSLVNARDEAAALRTRVEVLQEVVRRMDACWQQPRTPWQPGRREPLEPNRTKGTLMSAKRRGPKQPGRVVAADVMKELAELSRSEEVLDTLTGAQMKSLRELKALVLQMVPEVTAPVLTGLFLGAQMQAEIARDLNPLGGLLSQLTQPEKGPAQAHPFVTMAIGMAAQDLLAGEVPLPEAEPNR